MKKWKIKKFQFQFQIISLSFLSLTLSPFDTYAISFEDSKFRSESESESERIIMTCEVGYIICPRILIPAQCSYEGVMVNGGNQCMAQSKLYKELCLLGIPRVKKSLINCKRSRGFGHHLISF